MCAIHDLRMEVSKVKEQHSETKEIFKFSVLFNISFHFSDYQNEALEALLLEQEAMSELLGSLSISQAEAWHCFKTFRQICPRNARQLSAMP